MREPTRSVSEEFKSTMQAGMSTRLKALEYPELSYAMRKLEAYPYSTRQLAAAGAREVFTARANNPDYYATFLAKRLNRQPSRQWNMEYTAEVSEEGRLAVIGIGRVTRYKVPVGWRTEVGSRVHGDKFWVIEGADIPSDLAWVANSIASALPAHLEDPIIPDQNQQAMQRGRGN